MQSSVQNGITLNENNATANNQSSQDTCSYHYENEVVHIRDRDPYNILNVLTFNKSTICLNTTSTTAINRDLLDSVKQKAFLGDEIDGNYQTGNNNLCLTFQRHFLNCIKWKLDPTEYTLTNNGTLLYVTSIHTEPYALGQYNISPTDQSAHVCIPTEDLPQNISIDIAIFCLWILSLLSLLSLLVGCPLFRSSKSGAFWPLMFHAFSLFIRYMMITVFQIYRNPSRLFCVCIALTAHISFISANTWLNVMNFDMWRQFRKEGFSVYEPYSWGKFFAQGIYAWGLPAAVVGIAIALGSGCFPLVLGYKERCLIAVYDNSAQIIFFFGAIGVFVLINIILVFLTLINLCRKIDDLAKVNQRIRQQIVSTNLKLLILSGCTWLLLIVVRVSVSYDLPAAISTVIEFIMALQGILLLVIYVSAPSTRSKLKHLVICA